MSRKDKSSNPNQLAISFVPAVLRRKYADYQKENNRKEVNEEHTALLWIDVCNFSPLCNRLMKDATSGVEKITSILNSHYDFVLNLIHEYGGEPLFFAGDGLMSAWPAAPEKITQSVVLAAACAHKILNERNTFDDNKQLLSIHAIIAEGTWQLSVFKENYANLLFSFYGEAFSDLALASKNHAPNQVLISDAALAFLNKDLSRKPANYAASILLDAPPLLSVPEKSHLHLTKTAISKLNLFIPQTLIFQLNPERLKWIAEIRPVTILFVRLPNDTNNSLANLNHLRDSVKLIAPLVLKYDGLLNQIWIDEKDSNLLICFGPPPSAHMNNPERSVRLALEIHHLLLTSGFENSIGISSGMAYCGILGNDILRQYTVIGDVVNLSARITSIAKSKIFCDKATYHASNKVIDYKVPVNQNIKGFQEPIPLYEPINLLEHNPKALNITTSIGRRAELTFLMDAFDSTLAGESACIIVEGDSGMGKTRLLEDFKALILSGPGVLLPTSGDFIGRHTPYNIWVNIFSALLGLDQITSDTNKKEVYKAIEAKYGTKACLLNVVLQSNFADSEEIKNLTESQKVAVTHHFLLEVLKEESKKYPMAIVIDDAQWMVDEASWNLIKSVNSSLSSCLLVMSFQKTEGFPEVKTLQHNNVRRIILQELPDEAIDKLICAKLNTTRVSGEVSGLIKKIAKGNPFFCLELAGSLVDQELLSFENNSCSFIKDVSIDQLALPETVRGAVRQRIDRLNHGSQLSLKVASVVGNRFGKRIVNNIYPIEAERKLVPAYLKEAEKAGFLKEQTVDNQDGYLFNNATTSEVAYEMTLAEQRRYLHRLSAEWYENHYQENLFPFYVRLADHWLKAGDNSKASDYHEKEAIRLFRLGFVKQALDVGLEGVKLLNHAIDRNPDNLKLKIGEHLGFIYSFMENRSIESLLDHKKINNENTEKVIKILIELGPLAHQSQQVELFALMTIMCLQLTLEEGNGQSAAEVYAMYAIIHKSLTNDSVAAFAWSNLALAVDKKNNNTLQARVSFIHCWFIAHWLVPHKDLVAIASRGADAGLASGDILFGCFSLSLTVILKSTAGMLLSEVINTAESYLTRNNQMVLNAAFHLVHEAQVAKALQGCTTAFTSLTDEKHDETNDIASICNTDLYNQIGYYLVSKLKLNAHYGNWEEAISWGDKAMPLLPAFAHQPGEIDLEQFYTLAALYRAAETTGEVANKFMNLAQAGLQKINAWASLCPENFLHKVLLLQGVREGIIGKITVAEQLFEQAADKALASGYIQDQGLAYEHLARMQKRYALNTGKALDAAIVAYTNWGATGKVKYLHDQFTF